MTAQPNESAELREQLTNKLENFYRFGSDDHADIAVALDAIMALITQETTRARIDELKSFMALAEEKSVDTHPMGGYPMIYQSDIDNYCIPRLEALRKDNVA